MWLQLRNTLVPAQEGCPLYIATPTSRYDLQDTFGVRRLLLEGGKSLDLCDNNHVTALHVTTYHMTKSDLALDSCHLIVLRPSIGVNYLCFYCV